MKKVRRDPSPAPAAPGLPGLREAPRAPVVLSVSAMKFFEDDWLTIHQGDVRDVLPSLPADSVDCICTSPPYWGLRDYGTASWVGGEAECDHAKDRSVGIASSTLDGGKATTNHQHEAAYRHVCGKCGATRSDGQLGLERTPEEYVTNLVAVFRELRRVLKSSGTCWLNLGDSYQPHHTQRARPNMGLNTKNARTHENRMAEGLKHKDLVGIPWRVAFALQADGWYLRSDIIWAKPNPMPESVTDRPTKSHEYLFLLTKSARYYFDADAVREPSLPSSIERMKSGWNGNEHRDHPNGGHDNISKYIGTEHGMQRALAGRNLRSVWTIATKPYPGAHFAVFPSELPERCIKAGSSERGVCPECGAPWERILDVMRGERDDSTRSPEKAAARRGMAAVPEKGWESTRMTTGWGRTCNHVVTDSRDSGVFEYEPQPSVVLDPFAGSGTTGMVANRLSRRAILVDLNGSYLVQQMKRNAQVPLGLAT